MDKVQSLGEAREVGRLPGRDPACPHDSEGCHASPVQHAQQERLALCNRCTGKTGFAANVCWRMKQCVCPAGRPSRGPARQPGHFSCFAKRSNQEKATPEMAPRYAGFPRRWHRNREASETRCAQTADASLSDFGTSDVAPSTGISRQRQPQRSLRGATCNRNCRCAKLADTAEPTYMLTRLTLKGLSLTAPPSRSPSHPPAAPPADYSPANASAALHRRPGGRDPPR